MAQPLIGARAIVHRIAEDTQTPRDRVLSILDSLAEQAAIGLAEGKRVRIPGIGILQAIPTPAREVTGPDGRTYQVPAGVRVKLRPSIYPAESAERIQAAVRAIHTTAEDPDASA